MRIEDKGGSSYNKMYKILLPMEKLLMQYVEMRHFLKNTDVPLAIGLKKYRTSIASGLLLSD